MELFDCQTGFGGMTPGRRDNPTAADWLAVMERLSVGRALVRTLPEAGDRDTGESNDELFAACAESTGAGGASLVACPTVVPAAGGSAPPEADQVDAAIARGAGAVNLRPAKDLWSTAEWCAGALFGALAERRVPAVCEAKVFGLEAIADIAGRHPELPIVMVGPDRSFSRTILALLESFGNVFLSVGSPVTVHGGVEQLAERIGPERLLFGTGFPAADPMPAITMVTYAEISDADKQLIGSGNLERLLEGVAR